MRALRSRAKARVSGVARGGTRTPAPSFRARQWVLFALLLAGAAALMGRAVNLQLVDHGFLASQGDALFSRVATIPAHRGNIVDRNG